MRPDTAPLSTAVYFSLQAQHTGIHHHTDGLKTASWLILRPYSSHERGSDGLQPMMIRFVIRMVIMTGLGCHPSHKEDTQELATVVGLKCVKDGHGISI